MPRPETLVFLPGAAGVTEFWQPLAGQLRHPATREIIAYPGFGNEPTTPEVNSLDDLVARVTARLDRPSALIAQSMGGVIAVRIALARPDLVTHLVLSVTSGGLDMKGFGAADWRDGFAAANPRLPDWFLNDHTDLSPQIADIRQPTLLLWGDDDPLSPVVVGECLHGLLANSRLHVVPGGRHDLGKVHASELAPMVDAHLAIVLQP